MFRGTKPMPRNLRVLRGVEGRKLPTAPDNPAPEPPVKVPPPPAGMTPEEENVFLAMARKLAGMRVMSEADVEALVIYSRNWVDAMSARQKVQAVGQVIKSPKGFLVYNPWLAVARKAEAVCMRILTEFGLTPSSRNRVG